MLPLRGPDQLRRRGADACKPEPRTPNPPTLNSVSRGFECLSMRAFTCRRCLHVAWPGRRSYASLWMMTGTARLAVRVAPGTGRVLAVLETRVRVLEGMLEEQARPYHLAAVAPARRAE